MAVQILPTGTSSFDISGEKLSQALQTMAQDKLQQMQLQRQLAQDESSLQKAGLPTWLARYPQALPAYLGQYALPEQQGPMVLPEGMPTPGVTPGVAPGAQPSPKASVVTPQMVGGAARETQPKSEAEWLRNNPSARNYAPTIRKNLYKEYADNWYKQIGTQQAEEKIELGKSKQAFTEQKAGAEELKPMREAADAADTMINSYNELAAYAKTGNLQTGAGPSLLEKVGWESLLEPETLGYKSTLNKMILNLAKNLKGNTSDKDIRFLDKAVPSLVNTPAGISKLATIGTLNEQMNRLPYTEALGLIKNKNKIPLTIQDDARESARNKKKLYSKIITGIIRGEKFNIREADTGEREIQYKNVWLPF